MSEVENRSAVYVDWYMSNGSADIRHLQSGIVELWDTFA